MASVNVQVQLKADIGAAPLEGAQVHPGHLVVLTAAADSTAPVVGPFTPAAGTPLARLTAISFSVSDNLDLRAVIVIAMFVDGAGQTWKELVHDGTSFTRDYLGSQNTRTGDEFVGFAYTVLRDGGWPYPVNLQVFAIDTAGNEAP